MTSRSREKVAAAFRKLFRSPEKIDNDGAGPSGSPARRGLLRRHRWVSTMSPPTLAYDIHYSVVHTYIFILTCESCDHVGIPTYFGKRCWQKTSKRRCLHLFRSEFYAGLSVVGLFPKSDNVLDNSCTLQEVDTMMIDDCNGRVDVHCTTSYVLIIWVSFSHVISSLFTIEDWRK